MTQYRLNKNFKIRGSKNLPVDGLTTRTRNVREEALTMKFGIFSGIGLLITVFCTSALPIRRDEIQHQYHHQY